jgi:lysyl-tRNA synthetase class 2
LDPSKYTDNRKGYIQNLRDNGVNPYPHKFSRTHRIDQFRTDFDATITENGTFDDQQTVAVTGRIRSIRAAGPKLIFIDLDGDSSKV